jgi:aminotransferase
MAGGTLVNPTGGVVLSDTKAAIARLAEARNLLVLADELYEHIVYDGLEVRSFATFPRMRERTILLNGVSKAYCMTGFRVGYLAGPAPLVSGMVEPHHTITICASTISQHAAMAALTGPQDCLEAYLAIYDQRRRTLASGLAAAGIRFGKPRGAFFIFADVRPTGLRSLDFCAQFLQRERVLIFPGNLYGPGGEGFVRISYLASLDELEEAMVRFERFFADLV